MVKIDAAAEWQWREASILIILLFHLILFQSYRLKRKHVANEGQHGEWHKGGDLDQERFTK